MERMFYNITWSDIDSKIIQDIEHAKETPGFDINLGYKDNWSLLITAVYYCRKELVRYILSFPNIDVNHRSYYGNTALHCCDNVSILKLLLDHKDLDVNIQNEGGETGLHHACYMGRKTCVKEYLLDARADILIRDENGVMVRDYALIYGYLGIANILKRVQHTSLLRIPNRALLHDIVRMIIDEYT